MEDLCFIMYNIRKKNIFTTNGSLKASVIEVADIVSVSDDKKLTATKSKTFCVIKIVDESGIELNKHYSEVHNLFLSQNLIIGEEFIFENVYSNYSLAIAFYFLSNGNLNAPILVGSVIIPISRIEENTPVNAFDHSIYFAAKIFIYGLGSSMAPVNYFKWRRAESCC